MWIKSLEKTVSSASVRKTFRLKNKISSVDPPSPNVITIKTNGK